MHKYDFDKEVLVIGGSGFLGSHLVDHLNECGYDVTVFDNKKSPWIQNHQKIIIGDILNFNELRSAVAGKKFVFHLAGIADIGKADVNPKDTIISNIIGTTNVIEACCKETVDRLMFASTIYVYSQKGSFYRVSKQASELILENYHETLGLEYTILRYGSLYGPRSQDWNGFKRYISQAVKENRIIYHGDGQEKREYIHVKDAAKLTVQALEPRYSNRSLTITGSRVISSKELMIMIKEILGKDIDVKFINENRDPNHYTITPYRFTPKAASKIVPTDFYDLGQGILDMIEEVYNDEMKGV